MNSNFNVTIVWNFTNLTQIGALLRITAVIQRIRAHTLSTFGTSFIPVLPPLDAVVVFGGSMVTTGVVFIAVVPETMSSTVVTLVVVVVALFVVVVWGVVVGGFVVVFVVVVCTVVGDCVIGWTEPGQYKVTDIRPHFPKKTSPTKYGTQC